MVTIHFFAGLKRFFPASVQLNKSEAKTGQDILTQLKELMPDATDLLNVCRMAINEEFVDISTPINNATEVFLIPPSSGG